MSNEKLQELDRVQALLESSNTGNAVWDFSVALGNTVREKADSLFLALAHFNQIFYHKSGGSHSNMLVGDGAFCAFLEFGQDEFQGYVHPNPVATAIGVPAIYSLGLVYKRWLAFRHMGIAPNKLLMTRWDKEGGLSKYGVLISISNFCV